MSKQKNTGKVSKREIRRQAAQREKRMRVIRIWGPVGIAILGLIIFAVLRAGNAEEVEGVTIVSSAQSNQHDADLQIAFGGLPPMGGPHNPIWQNCGIYDTPVAGEYAIHSMEHGAVWLTYNPDLPADQISQLQNTVRGDNYLLLSPYPDQTADIVLTVWDRQLVVDDVNDVRIGQFIDNYRRTRGPESTSACSGGVGEPIG
ncbi:MAG: DUF3105 domain-containing protein [Anaerolineales bacterium]|nr:DUF3105 domain-containing protein [Anaerolineales bacterium]MCA9930160.1 DUF3105 domain-containing protein [Anaerolineales bacterium]